MIIKGYGMNDSGIGVRVPSGMLGNSIDI